MKVGFWKVFVFSSSLMFFIWSVIFKFNNEEDLFVVSCSLGSLMFTIFVLMFIISILRDSSKETVRKSNTAVKKRNQQPIHQNDNVNTSSRKKLGKLNCVYVLDVSFDCDFESEVCVNFFDNGFAYFDWVVFYRDIISYSFKSSYIDILVEIDKDECLITFDGLSEPNMVKLNQYLSEKIYN